MDDYVNQTEQNKSNNFFVKISKNHFQKLSNPYHLSVFMELAQFQKDAFPSQATISKNRGMSLRQVKYSLAYLLAENLIEKVQSKRGMTVHYRIVDISTTQAQSAQVPRHTVPTPQAYSAYPPRHTVPTINKSIKKKNYVCNAREAPLLEEQPTHTISKDKEQPQQPKSRDVQSSTILSMLSPYIVEDNQKPQKVWIPFQPILDELDVSYAQMQKVQNILEKGRTFLELKYCQNREWLQMKLDQLAGKPPNLTVVKQKEEGEGKVTSEPDPEALRQYNQLIADGHKFRKDDYLTQWYGERGIKVAISN